MAETTKMTAYGIIDGKKIQLNWSKGEYITQGANKEPISFEIEKRIDELTEKGELIIAGYVELEPKTALWAYNIFFKIFDERIKLLRNGEPPTLEYDPNVIY